MSVIRPVLTEELPSADQSAPDFRPAQSLDATSAWKLLIKDLVLPASIGVYQQEYGRKQPVAITIEIDYNYRGTGADGCDYLCYDGIVRGIEGVLAAGHIGLVETLAEKVADFVLRFPEAASVLVRVSKPEAIEKAKLVGVQVRKTKRRP